MRGPFWWTHPLLLAILGCATAPTSPPVALTRNSPLPAEQGSTTCQSDFERSQEIVENSYSAYTHKLDPVGRDEIKTATRKAKEQTHHLNASAPACRAALRTWLKVFADGHLFLLKPEQLAAMLSDDNSSDPQVFFEQVSTSVVLLRIESFSKPAEVVGIIRKHRREIESAKRLLLDLRGNGGGNDLAYAPLLKFLYTAPYTVIGDDVLSTIDNIEAWRRITPLVPPEDSQSVEQIEKTIASMLATPGGFIRMDDDKTVVRERILKMPRHVDIFYDRRCASSCEAFLLEARHSSKVTTFGTNSAGVIDHGNVRFTQLPSQEHVLAWPTTRSRRIPNNPIDGVGIPPAVPIAADRLAEFNGQNMARVASERR